MSDTTEAEKIAFRELNERLKTFQGWDFALEGYCPTFEVTDSA